jgi:hypothetical protein
MRSFGANKPIDDKRRKTADKTYDEEKEDIHVIEKCGFRHFNNPINPVIQEQKKIPSEAFF